MYGLTRPLRLQNTPICLSDWKYLIQGFQTLSNLADLSGRMLASFSWSMIYDVLLLAVA